MSLLGAFVNHAKAVELSRFSLCVKMAETTAKVSEGVCRLYSSNPSLHGYFFLNIGSTSTMPMMNRSAVNAVVAQTRSVSQSDQIRE